MKLIIFLLFISFYLINLEATAQTTSGWAWALRDSLNEAPIDLVTDAAGNVYTIGASLKKYSPAGILLWNVKLSGSTQWLYPKGMTIDGSGNIYIAGNFPFSIMLDTIPLTSVGKRDIFVAKFNPAGRVQWARRAGGTGNIVPNPGYIDDTAWDVAVDAAGNCYISVGCHTLGTVVQFDSITIPANTGRAFMAKYNTNGKIRWVTHLNVPEAQKIGINSQGILILSGFSLTCYSTSNGTVVWSKTKTGNGSAIPYGYYNDAAGNSYLTGTFKDTITFSPYTLTATPGGTAIDGDIFLVKYDHYGNVKWANKSTRTGSNGLRASYGQAVATDNRGNVYVTGGFQGTISFGSNIQVSTSSFSTDVFAVKYDSSGTALWAAMGDSGGEGFGSAIGAAPNGDCFVTGQFKTTASFPPHLLASPTGYSEFFIAKYSANLLSVPKNIAASKLQLYPNPATSELIVHSGNQKSNYLEIFSLTGQQVFSTSFQTEIRINVAEYPASMYLVKLTSEGKTETQKLIVTH